MTTPEETFFVAGGTVPPGSPSYVERAADRELFEALRSGKYCYVLNSRQMGKSSLAVRTVSRLEEEGVRTAFVDLTKIGSSSVTEEQWYVGVLAEIGRSLGLRKEVVEHLREHKELSPSQRLITFLQEVVCDAGTPVVLFIDEVDAIRSLSFSTDAFFAGIRQCWNARSNDPKLDNLTFCLMGAALQADLIRDPRMTPFNVGRRIELRDFTREEARPLSQALRDKGQAALERVMYWSGGHPFLTQTLCEALTEHSAPGGNFTRSEVDALVKNRYLDGRARDTDTNLADVGNRLLGRGDPGMDEAKLADVLSTYARLLKGLAVQDDEANPSAARIKMSGVARVDTGRLKIRNRIYQEVFGRAWIRENMPGQELRRQKRAFWLGALRAGTLATIVITAIAALAWRNAALAARNDRLAHEREYEAYVADVNLMRAAYDNNDLALLARLLDETKQSPFRNIEWAFWNSTIHDGSQEVAFPVEQGEIHLSGDGKMVAITDRTRQKGEVRTADDLRLVSKVPSVKPNSTLLVVRGKAVVADWDGDVSWKMRDALSGRVLYRVQPPAKVKGIGLLVPSSNGRYLCGTALETGDTANRDALVWDTSTGQLLHRFRTNEDHARRINSAAVVSEDGNTLLIEEVQQSATAVPADYLGGRYLAAVDLRSGATIETIPTNCFVQSISVSRDGSRYAYSSSDSRVIVREPRSHRTVLNQPCDLFDSSMFSADGRRLVIGGRDLGCRVWDIASQQLVIKGRGATWVALSGDGRSAIVTGKGTRLYRDARGAGNELRFPRTWAELRKFNAHGQLVIDTGHAAHIVDPETMTQRRMFPSANIRVPLSFDGNWMFLTDRANGGDVVSTADGRKLCHIPTWGADGADFDVSADGQRVLLVDIDTRHIRVYDSKGKLLASLETHGSSMNCCRWKHRGQEFAVGYFDGHIEIFKPKGVGWSSEGSYPGLASGVNAIEFSPNDRLVGIGGSDPNVIVLSLDDGKSVVCRGHTSQVREVAFSNDGARLLTTGDDGTARLWDTASGRSVLSVPADIPIRTAAVDPSQKRLFISGWNGAIRRFDLDEGFGTAEGPH